jgi:hypothetical protein
MVRNRKKGVPEGWFLRWFTALVAGDSGAGFAGAGRKIFGKKFGKFSGVFFHCEKNKNNPSWIERLTKNKS